MKVWHGALTIRLLDPKGCYVKLWLLRILGFRVLRFVCVGVLCLLLQILFLTLFKHYTHLIFANVSGFVLSAQANFMLSYHYTWHDSKRHAGRLLWATWAKFNLVVLGSACINGVAFASLRYTFIGVDEYAAIAATLISTAFTFSVNHLFVLKPVGVKNGGTARNSDVPAGLE